MTRPGRRDEGGSYPHREITAAVIAAAIRVQQHLGPGLLERVYKDCLAHGLGLDGHGVQQDVRLDITYEGLRVPNAFSMDMVVDDRVVVAVRTGERLGDFHYAVVKSCLRFSGLEVGLILNFRAWPLKEGGIKRVIYSARS